MSSLKPRDPYTNQELEQLYPKELELQLVQILLRHGERSPVSARFRNAGLPAHWPYCSAAKRLSSVMMATPDSSQWNHLEWRRRLESFGTDDGPTIARGPKGEIDGVCQLGELTDRGRETTLALGERLRHLYVTQLGFMPRLISDADMIYLRATPMPRALESVQQAFWGMYPLTARTASFPPPTIITRTPADETLYPNEANCRRFSQLSRAFAQRTADRWNESDEMRYLNKLIAKWMPQDSPQVAVDSHPRLSGIMDTINSTLSHGPETRLPKEFYDPRGRKIIEQIGVEEWFSGYKESQEYRSVGVGALVGDVVSRMVGSVESNGNDGILEVGGESGSVGTGRGGEKSLKFGLSGCHDTTLAGFLSSFGAFGSESWPPYTSHIALELFRANARAPDSVVSSSRTAEKDQRLKTTSRLAALFGGDPQPDGPGGIARRPWTELSTDEKKSLEDYYVRVRYNDKPMIVPGCRALGNHLPGDESFCTLEAFKRIADKFTPKNWKQACDANLDEPAFPAGNESAGH